MKKINGKNKKPSRSIKPRLAVKLNEVNRILNGFERDLENIIKKMVAQSKRSRHELRKNFEGILSKIRDQGLLATANSTREEVEKELKTAGEEIMGTFKDIELLLNPQNFSNFIQKIRNNVFQRVKNLGESSFANQAKQTIVDRGQGVLSFLSIPTQKEVEKLERKIVGLERRLSTLAKRAA